MMMFGSRGAIRGIQGSAPDRAEKEAQEDRARPLHHDPEPIRLHLSRPAPGNPHFFGGGGAAPSAARLRSSAAFRISPFVFFNRSGQTKRGAVERS